MASELPGKIQYKKLSRSVQIDYEIFQYHLKQRLWIEQNTQPFRNDPLLYNDYISESIYLLLTQSTQDKRTNIKNCATRMQFIPRVVKAARANLGTPPRIYVETAIRRNRGRGC